MRSTTVVLFYALSVVWSVAGAVDALARRVLRDPLREVTFTRHAHHVDAATGWVAGLVQ